MKRICSAVMIAVLLLSLAACQSRAGRGATVQAETTAASTALEPTVASTAPETTAATTQPPETEPVLSYVEVFREGEISQIPVQIIRGTVGDYTIAMDPEYFTFSAHETVDLFLYEAWDGTQAVAYSVSDYIDDADPQEFIDSVVQQFGHLYGSHAAEQTTIGTFDATAVYFSNLKEDPAYQMHVFLVNCQGEYYLIEATFVFEMYEGLYAIMRALFDTFTPI